VSHIGLRGVGASEQNPVPPSPIMRCATCFSGTVILNVLVPDQTELTREQVCEDLGIADCPENDDEIARYMESATV